MTATWDIEPGTVCDRRAVQECFGGQRQVGIAKSDKTPNTLLFVKRRPGQDDDHPYDGWDAATGVFHYMGQGSGDHEWNSYNKAILEHRQNGHSLRVFMSDPSSGSLKQRQDQIYIGEFQIDEDRPYDVCPLGVQGRPRRNVIVFRLRPVTGVVWPEGGAALTQAESECPSVALIPLENGVADSYETTPTLSARAVRREAELVQHFSKWLESQDHDVWRYYVKATKSGGALFTDIFDVTADVLYEAKASADPVNIRLGLGQLLDYRRYIDSSGQRLLVPERPHDKYVNLLAAYGIGIAYPRRGKRMGFELEDPPISAGANA